MRHTNFVKPVRSRPGLVTAALWALALGLAGFTGWALLEAARATADARRLEAHAVRLGQELDAMAVSNGSVPTESEIADLAVSIERLNTLSGPRHTTLPRLLETLEQGLPAAVWIGQLTYSAESGAFAVSLLSEDETLLPIALRRIEDMPPLSEVILERQVRVQGGTRNLLQYDIRAMAE